MARNVDFEALFENNTMFSWTVCVASLQLFAFVPTSVLIVSFIEIKVFRNLSGQVSSKTVDVWFVMIKVMDQCGTVQLACRTANYPCWLLGLATILLYTLAFFRCRSWKAAREHI